MREQNSPNGTAQPGDASYQVLARRSRPQSFAELVGQESVASSIGTLLSSGRIPHAVLFTGTRGTGKTSSARILAKSLCCVNGPTISPCQVCHHCVAITACGHEDVLEIDGASNTGVDNIRELREAARFHPISARFKVFIIDEVHMLSIGAFNALLKTLEEPPPSVVFILATTELHKVPVTVRSRCMLFTFKKYAVERIATHLKSLLEKDGIEFDEDAVMLVAREAKGSMRDSLNLLEQALAFSGGKRLDAEKTHAVLSVLGEDIAQNLFAALCAGRADDALIALKDADDASLDLASLLDTTATFARHALVLREVGDRVKATRLTALLPMEMERLIAATGRMSATALGEFYRMLSQASRDAARSTAPLQWAEVAVLDCISRADWLSAGELLAHLSAVGVGASGASANAPAALPPVAPAAQASPWAGGARVPLAKPAGAPGSAPQADVDFPTVSALIAQVEKKSPGLGKKLRHALFDEFSPARVAFKAGQNSLYTDYTESDAALFVEGLRAIGLGGAELSGIVLPKGVIWRATARPGDARTNPPGASPSQPISPAPAIPMEPTGAAPSHSAPGGLPSPRPRADFLTRPSPEKKNNVTDESTADARTPAAAVSLPVPTPNATRNPTPVFASAPPQAKAPPEAPSVSNTRSAEPRSSASPASIGATVTAGPLPLPHRSPPTQQVSQTQSASPRVSLATHEKHVREQEFAEKSTALLARPELAELVRTATRVDVVPLAPSTETSDE